MTYSVKELFYTLQGEGLRAGRPAIFCRFAGCNLWSGREVDRQEAICRFCDTDFIGTDGTMGGKYPNAQSLAQTISDHWPVGHSNRYIVLTGGEPLLQVDIPLIDALHASGFEIAVETNGSIHAPEGIDWLSVSPKAGAPWLQKSGQELKLVYPQKNLMPSDFDDLSFENYLLQPMDGPMRSENTQQAIKYCQSHPKWRLSIQTHKIINIR